jgi:hypothetical protein
MSGNCDFPVGSEEIEVDFAGAGIVKYLCRESNFAKSTIVGKTYVLLFVHHNAHKPTDVSTYVYEFCSDFLRKPFFEFKVAGCSRVAI